MKERPIKLTDDEIAAILDLGSKNLDCARIPEDAFAELVRLGIVERLSDGTAEFTDLGKEVRHALFRRAA